MSVTERLKISGTAMSLTIGKGPNIGRRAEEVILRYLRRVGGGGKMVPMGRGVIAISNRPIGRVVGVIVIGRDGNITYGSRASL